MVVYVVLESDEDLGAYVVGVYHDRAEADAVADEDERRWVVEKDLT